MVFLIFLCYITSLFVGDKMGRKRLSSETSSEVGFFENTFNKKGKALTFEDCYRVKESWMDEVPNPMAFLASMYSMYFVNHNTNPSVNFERLLQGIKIKPVNSQCTKALHDAREVFTNIFRLRYQANPEPGRHYSSIQTYQDLIQNHGENLMAHGVEEAKGGMYNLLMMCICDCVQVPERGWGSLVNIGGAPNLSPESHGPYFIIASTHGDDAPHRPSISQIEYVLLPFRENIDDLKEQLARVREHGMITEEQQEAFEAKLISYEALNELLDKRMLNHCEEQGEILSFSQR